MNNESELVGEIALWSAVISQAVRDLSSKGDGARKARLWFKSRDFIYVAGLIAVDYEEILNALNKQGLLNPPPRPSEQVTKAMMEMLGNLAAAGRQVRTILAGCTLTHG